MPSSTLIISTFNRPDALQRCLESVVQQVRMPERIVVADDGSTSQTAALISSFRNILGADRLIHEWQEDHGFRVARIRNKALQRAEGTEYIIQIDGDMVLDTHFVQDHCIAARPGYYCRGNKMMLNTEQTQTILTHGNTELRTMHFPFSKAAKARRVAPLLHLSVMLHLDIRGVFGSNMSYWLSDAVTINGYDNAFEGWGSEDDDFADRLRLLGVRCTSLKFGAIAYHLEHPEHDRSAVSKNDSIRRQSHEQRLLRAVNGLNESTTSDLS